MKLTKRMKSAIIQASIANGVFFLILASVIGFFMVPNILEVESKKGELETIFAEYTGVKTKGISFEDLQATINQQGITDDNIDIGALLRNISKSFYVQNFSNNSGGEYEVFLEGVKSEIVNIKTSEKYIEQDKKLDTILPVYTSDSSFQADSLTDFHFINYIENLIYTFNISSEGQIGIGDIEKISDTQVVVSGDDMTSSQGEYVLGEDIFKIPMQFQIEGQKSDIIDFIHFFENVGSISLEDGDIEIYSDKFITKVLEGETRNSEYNIYENQIADIESINWLEYPDSSTSQSQGVGLISALKGSQAREKATVAVSINFYVAGVPGYRMEKYIQEVFDLYSELSSQISADANKYSSQAYKYKEGKEIQAISQMQNLDSLLREQEKDIGKMRLSLARKENIQALYEQTITLRTTLKWIDQSYQQQKDIFK